MGRAGHGRAARRVVADLIQATGKGRTWVYERLRQLADVGRVIHVQTIRGHWRAATPPR